MKEFNYRDITAYTKGCFDHQINGIMLTVVLQPATCQFKFLFFSLMGSVMEINCFEGYTVISGFIQPRLDHYY